MIGERARGRRAGSVSSVGAAVSGLVADVVGVCTANRPVGRRLSRDINLLATLMGVGDALPEFALYVPPVRAARTRFARFMRQALDEHRLEERRRSAPS